jgi:hypothetical protein
MSLPRRVRGRPSAVRSVWGIWNAQNLRAYRSFDPYPAGPFESLHDGRDLRNRHAENAGDNLQASSCRIPCFGEVHDDPVLERLHPGYVPRRWAMASLRPAINIWILLEQENGKVGSPSSHKV